MGTGKASTSHICHPWVPSIFLECKLFLRDSINIYTQISTDTLTDLILLMSSTVFFKLQIIIHSVKRSIRWVTVRIFKKWTTLEYNRKQQNALYIVRMSILWRKFSSNMCVYVCLIVKYISYCGFVSKHLKDTNWTHCAELTCWVIFCPATISYPGKYPPSRV